jgi:hypothetical protein
VLARLSAKKIFFFEQILSFGLKSRKVAQIRHRQDEIYSTGLYVCGGEENIIALLEQKKQNPYVSS